MSVEWINPDLTTTDYENLIFGKRDHLEQIRICEDLDPQVYDNAGNKVVSNAGDDVQIEIGHNLKEIRFDEVAVSHKLIEYTPYKYNSLGLEVGYIFTDTHFTKDEVVKNTLSSADWGSADEIRMISDVLVPDGSEQSLTADITTFRQLAHLQEIRDTIDENLRLKTRQTLSELMGITRTEINCPFTGCNFSILSTELYCSRAYASTNTSFTTRWEPQVEWYQEEDDTWNIQTWTDPFIHTILQATLSTDYSVGVTSISFTANIPARIPIIPNGETREEALNGSLTLDLPDNSYLFFDNHYRRYAITECTGSGNNYTLTFTPPLEFDVLEDSNVNLSNHRVYEETTQGETIITIDASNAVLITLSEFLGEYGFGGGGGSANYEHWESKYKVDKYFYTNTLVKFQSHDKIYSIATANPNLVEGNYQITLNETLEQALEENEAIFLYTQIKATHWEELRTVLENLDATPNEFQFWGYFNSSYKRGDRVSPAIESKIIGGTIVVSGEKWGNLTNETIIIYQDPVLICPIPGKPADSSYTRYGAQWAAKVTCTLDTLRGIAQYVYEDDDMGGDVWRQQIVGGKVVRYGRESATVRKFSSFHECPNITADPYWTVYDYASLQFQEVTADGIDICDTLVNGYIGYFWMNDIKRNTLALVASGPQYLKDEKIFKNSILIYPKKAVSSSNVSFADEEYATFMGTQLNNLLVFDFEESKAWYDNF